MRNLVIEQITRTIWPEGVGNAATPGWYHTSRYKIVLVKMYEHVPRDPAMMPKKPKWLHSGYDYRNPMDVANFYRSFDWNILTDDQVIELFVTTVRREWTPM